MISKLIERFFGIAFSEKVHKVLERAVLITAAILYSGHLILIFLNRMGINTFIPDENYLNAIATPFTVLLFFELYQLVRSISVSISDSVLVQYEIISLILVRNFFKEISTVNLSILDPIINFNYLIFNSLATLVLFSVVACFYLIKIKLRNRNIVDYYYKINEYRAVRKGMTIFATIALICIAVITLVNIESGHITNSVFEGRRLIYFFDNMFLILILIDVFLIIISSLFKEKYEYLIRDSGLIISAIIMRLGITISKELTAQYIIFGAIFGLIVYFLYYKTIDVFKEYTMPPYSKKIPR